ncbi:hypothetical protein [Noviherbaspirillum suwonense]|uniref:Uncharacterized protein n=1 Tax=Noviherbaspirillum suwonense TaxID=1224511 RepID=A0ABY1PTD3_9BURK|nr:hypothetical protein [Noviherbaspirillum suwonense]SMP45115.1 hypothetical protein SAMN06295970_101480 [Noviherbaspirillum suwonense]
MQNTPKIFTAVDIEEIRKQYPQPAIKNGAVTEPKDTTEVFWELSRLCYTLFTVLGAVGKFINEVIRNDVAALAARNSAQSLVLESGPKPSETPPKDNQPFGFGGTDENALQRANELMDYFHQFGIASDFPPGYDKDQSIRVTETTRNQMTVGQFNNYINLMNNQVDRYKNNSGTESTKAKGTLDSINAAIELSTAVVKSITTTQTTVAAKI